MTTHSAAHLDSDDQFTVRRSEWVTTLLYLDGKPFSLEHFPFYRHVYDNIYPALLLKTARQVAKSTTLANFLIMEACSTPHWKSFFIAPSQEQTTKFSQTRVGKTIFYSPDIRKRWVSKELSSRVYQKMFTNGSELAFSYASDDPDRARGVSADRVAYDEVQDILYDEVIPVVNECMANSDFAYETYCGTPKSMENTIEQLWQWSTQTEWVVKCTGCNTYQFFVDDKCIGKNGPICLKCGKYLDVRNGEWIDTHVYPKDFNGKRIKGFHVPQVILPKNVPASMPMDFKNQEVAVNRWRRITDKLAVYPPSKFKNEVMGVSDAIGTRLISKEELEGFCRDYQITDYPPQNLMLSDIRSIVAGVDWSGGGTTGNSRTVFWIWGMVAGSQEHNFKLKTLYFKIYPETNPISGGVIDHICDMCERYGVSLIIGDAGEGALANANLRERLGAHRAYQVQYRGVAGGGSGGGSARPFYWNKIDRFLAERTTMIDHFFMFVKRGGVIYPNVKQMQTPIKDMLNEYEEVTNQGRKVWRHAPAQPDDSLHAQIFGWMAAKFVSGDPLFTYAGS